MDKKTVGIIGCGNIGQKIAGYINKDLSNYVSKLFVWDVDKLREKNIKNASRAKSLVKLVKSSDLVIECAAPPIVKEVLALAIKNKKDAIVLSIGGLLDNPGLLARARKNGTRIILPSGAISGIDALKAAKLAGIKSVTITTKKHPKSLKNSMYLRMKGIDTAKFKKDTIVFNDTARAAIKAFPKNVNVSVLLSIAGIGPDKTKVKVIVCPKLKKNVHEIEIKSKACDIFTRVENLPSPDNPGTSYLAILSAITSLREYFDTIRIGT